jgi:hypothetical protein
MPMRTPVATPGSSERQAIVLSRDTERLAEFTRAGAQVGLLAQAAAPPHYGEPFRGLDCPDEHGAGAALFLAHKVEAPMNSVRAVDIGIAGWAKHHSIALGAAIIGMRGWVGVVVGLDFDNNAAGAVDEQRRADQLGRNHMHRAVKK